MSTTSTMKREKDENIFKTKEIISTEDETLNKGRYEGVKIL